VIPGRLHGDVRVPAKSTIHAVLDRHGLVNRMSKRRNRATGTPLSPGVAPNDLWRADYKGEFRGLHRNGAAGSRYGRGLNTYRHLTVFNRPSSHVRNLSRPAQGFQGPGHEADADKPSLGAPDPQ
jgi:hypothetical protein